MGNKIISFDVEVENRQDKSKLNYVVTAKNPDDACIQTKALVMELPNVTEELYNEHWVIRSLYLRIGQAV